MPIGMLSSIDRSIICKKSLGTVLKTSQMNLISWYNPDNVTVSGSNVTSWPDSLNNNNLTTIASGVPIKTTGPNSKSVIQAASTTVGCRITTPAATNPTIGGILFSANVTNNCVQANNLIEYFGLFGSDLGIRYLALNGTLNNGDLTFPATGSTTNGSLWYNGTQVSTSAGVVTTIKTTFPTNYFIQYCKFDSTRTTAVTRISILGYANPNVRNFVGYSGDCFLTNTSFTTTQQIQLEGYLGYKYSTQNLLPTGHLYYSATNSKIVTLIVG
jgi:hypothetical protein